MYSVENAISAWVVEHDQVAAAWLIHEHRGLVLSTARRWGVPAEMEEDAAQEVFVRVFNSLHLFRPDRPFVHWLSVITRNTCAKLRRYWCQRHRLSAVFEEAAQEIGEFEFSHSMTPALEVEKREQLMILNEALSALTSQEKELFERQMIEGETASEAALRLGISQGAVRVAMHRVRRKLRPGLMLCQER